MIQQRPVLLERAEKISLFALSNNAGFSVLKAVLAGIHANEPPTFIAVHTREAKQRLLKMMVGEKEETTARGRREKIQCISLIV